MTIGEAIEELAFISNCYTTEARAVAIHDVLSQLVDSIRDEVLEEAAKAACPLCAEGHRLVGYWQNEHLHDDRDRTFCQAKGIWALRLSS